MVAVLKREHSLFVPIIGLLSWVIPGGGYFLLNQKKQAVIIFLTIVSTLCIGLYVGSIGVIDLVGTAAFYVKATQVMNPPIVFLLAHQTASGAYPVYGWPNEIGQIYTMTSGLLNLLCIINVVYLAHIRSRE